MLVSRQKKKKINKSLREDHNFNSRTVSNEGLLNIHDVMLCNHCFIRHVFACSSQVPEKYCLIMELCNEKGAESKISLIYTARPNHNVGFAVWGWWRRGGGGSG